MASRIAVPLALAGGLALILLTRPGPTRVQAQGAATESPPPAAVQAPPMFSPWYADALGDVLELEQAGAGALERQLAQNPEDFRARLKLMAYYSRADRAAHPDDVARRFEHALWLIEHHPDSEILHSYVSRFSPDQLSPAAYQRAARLWEAQSRSHAADAAVQWNAASFFETLDPRLYLEYLERTAAAGPNHPFALRPLAHLYATTILAGGPLAMHAQEALEKSQNVWILGNAAYMFQNRYNQSLQTGSPNTRAAALAERYFLRAKALNPGLDRSAILPQIDIEAVRRAHETAEQAARDWQIRADKAVSNIRRLPVDAFPKLPPVVARVLRARICAVPQPAAAGPPRNVISGEFFAKGENGWAVLCSVNNVTSLLVFRNQNDGNPAVLTTTDDRKYLQMSTNNQVVYSREITAVGRDFIMRHYRAYGGTEPPPIDHHGIDDAFLEKASITWYFHQGKWLQLQGAD